MPEKEIMKNKKKKFSFSKSVDSYFLLLLSFGILAGAIFFYLSKKAVVFVLCVLFFLGLYLLTGEEVLSAKEKKKKAGESEIYLSFYRNYYLFSSLFSSYEEGYEKAYSLLPVSHLKDDLSDAKESNAFELPLRRTGTRAEARLIDFLNKEKNSPEEPTFESLAELSSLLSSYEEEEKGKDSMADISYLSLLVLLLALAASLSAAGLF